MDKKAVPHKKRFFGVNVKSWGNIFPKVIPLSIVLLLVFISFWGTEAVASDPKELNRIVDLLADRNGDGRIDRLGEKVTVRGRATVGDKVFDDEYLMIYVQDSTAGILVFSDTLDVSVKKGDHLQVTGTLKLYASKPEIVVEELEVLKSPNRVPKAKPLSRVFQAPDRYRGQLVSGEAVVQNKNAPEGIKMLKIATSISSNDSLHIFVSRANRYYEDFNFDLLEAGDRIHISGILIRYISDYTGQTLYQVLPRSRADLTISNLQPVVSEGSFVYADIDTTSRTLYMLLESGLWGYNLSNSNWRFLDALEDFEGTFGDYEFGFNARANLIQLWSRGMGKLYSVVPETYKIEREDHSTEHRNQFGHFPFYRDSTLHAFGGYGFWEFHNLMVHFDHSRKEWEKQAVDHQSSFPSRRIPATGVYNREQDRLYIFGGRGTPSGYTKDQDSKGRELRDIWAFSFENKRWEKIVTLDQLKNSSANAIHHSGVGDINKRSSSFYLPNEQVWFIPAFNPKPLADNFHFRIVDLLSGDERGFASPGLSSAKKFIPTNYFYDAKEDEVVMVGIDDLAGANRFPVRVKRMPADSLMAKVSVPPFYFSAKLYYYLIGLLLLAGVWYWISQNRTKSEKGDEEEIQISYQSLLEASWYNEKEKRLLSYMREQDRFLNSQEIEELLWSDIESYDYRRRLRNDILKDINKKFRKHCPEEGKIILRKKDPTDNRRYLYGLNKQLLGE